MQDASSAFDTAAATHRTWVPPRMRTDWLLDGYDGDGSIDDLSAQASSEWTVSHDLDDGYPSSVSFVSGTAIPELGAELAGRVVNGVPMTAGAFWSPLRTDSPLYGIERDLQPLTLDMGLVTSSGPEYVRVFTGQTVNTPVKGGKAQLKALSAARIALMKQVLPPAFPAIYFGGLHASWVVSWCLFQCGIYAGPKIREGSTVLYYPMHGSFHRFLDADAPYGNLLTTEGINWIETTQADPVGTLHAADELNWIEGPYVAAPDLQLRTDLTRRAYQAALPFTYGDGQASAFTQSGNAGRLEAWIRGDQADVNTAPGGSGNFSRLFGLQLTNTSGGASAALGVDISRRVYVTVYDGTNRRTLTGATVPTDGAWHFIGAAYDMTADKLWTCMDNSSTSTGATMVTSALPATTDAFNDSTFLLSYLPFSDVSFATGTQANVDSYPLWRNDSTFAQTARVGLSPNKLLACAEPLPREAWSIIADYAQSELAMLRCDENDIVQYLPLSWWVKDAQQELLYSIDTQRNAAPFDIDYDPSKIRNSVTVSYSEATLPVYSAETGDFRHLYELPNSTEIRLDANSVTDLTFTFSGTKAAKVNTTVIFAVSDSDAQNLNAAGWTFVTLNTALDGSGTYVATDITDDVAGEIVSWNAGQVTMRLTNQTAGPLYLANNVSVPALVVTGVTVTEVQTYVTDSDAASVALRGERSMSMQSPAAQTQEMARRLARNVKMSLRGPRATIGDESSGINVLGDPRRQPGDLVAVNDAETGASGGLWRLQSVRHALRGAAYTQQLVVREVLPIGFVGVHRVGQCLVGPNRG